MRVEGVPGIELRQGNAGERCGERGHDYSVGLARRAHRLPEEVVYPVPLDLLARDVLVGRARDDDRLPLLLAVALGLGLQGALHYHLLVAPRDVEAADAGEVDVDERDIKGAARELLPTLLAVLALLHVKG